jgi:GTPase
MSPLQADFFFDVAMFRSGFVSIFGKPNAGKSTLLNSLIGEKLAIVSPKIQTTRHRIRAFLNGPNYQIIFSDTPGIIEPEYKLHEKMMQAVKNSVEDADVAILMVDIHERFEEVDKVFQNLKLQIPAILVLNKIDKVSTGKVEEAESFFRKKNSYREVLSISASRPINVDLLIEKIVNLLPEGEPFFAEEDLTDMPTRFFVGELVREKIFAFLSAEIPYQTAVQVTEFKEKQDLIKIAADIIVQRESQKAIILGERGAMIKKLGTEARKSIEEFLGSKVYLELFVKVKPKWRDNERQLKEYGYG